MTSFAEASYPRPGATAFYFEVGEGLAVQLPAGMLGRLSQLVIIQASVEPGCEMIGYQPSILVVPGGHVFQQSHQDFAEGAARLTSAALGVLGPVKVAYFEVSLVLSLGVPFGIAGTRLWAITYLVRAAFVIIAHVPASLYGAAL